MSEHEAPDSSIVPAAKGLGTKGEFLHRARAHVEELAPAGAIGGAVVAFTTMLAAFTMTPEEHVRPVGAPFAIALLALGLACSVGLLLRRPVADLRPRRGIQVLAALASLVACLLILLPFSELYYYGALWRSVQDDPSAEWLLDNVLVWVPIGLLVVSLSLASIGRRRWKQLLPWAGITIPGFVLMLWIVLVAGIGGVGGG